MINGNRSGLETLVVKRENDCSFWEHVILTRREWSLQIKVNTMERVDKLALQDEKLETSIADTQLIIKRLDHAARQICR